MFYLTSFFQSIFLMFLRANKNAFWKLTPLPVSALQRNECHLSVFSADRSADLNMLESLFQLLKLCRTYSVFLYGMQLVSPRNPTTRLSNPFRLSTSMFQNFSVNNQRDSYVSVTETSNDWITSCLRTVIAFLYSKWPCNLDEFQESLQVRFYK